MKIILLVVLVFSLNLFATDDDEVLFWNEIKDSKDIEDFKYYNERYPDGVYEYLSNKQIKKISRSKYQNKKNKKYQKDEIPTWIKGNANYRYYSVGYSNRHFKGKHYAQNLARDRAMRTLQDQYNDENIDDDTIYKYNKILKEEVFINKDKRTYVLIYIDDYDI